MSIKCYPAGKVGTYKVRSSGRGKVAALPESWIEDLQITEKDYLNIYRDSEDRLILERAKRRTA